jgi:hypothetical protein
MQKQYWAREPELGTVVIVQPIIVFSDLQRSSLLSLLVSLHEDVSEILGHVTHLMLAVHPVIMLQLKCVSQNLNSEPRCLASTKTFHIVVEFRLAARRFLNYCEDLPVCICRRRYST